MFWLRAFQERTFTKEDPLYRKRVRYEQSCEALLTQLLITYQFPRRHIHTHTNSSPWYYNPLPNCNNENKRKSIKMQVGFGFQKIVGFDLYPPKQLICEGEEDGICIWSRLNTMFLSMEFFMVNFSVLWPIYRQTKGKGIRETWRVSANRKYIKMEHH